MARERTQGLDEAKVEEKGLEAIGRGEKNDKQRPTRKEKAWTITATVEKNLTKAMEWKRKTREM